jgi:hypothetical protein
LATSEEDIGFENVMKELIRRRSGSVRYRIDDEEMSIDRLKNVAMWNGT